MKMTHLTTSALLFLAAGIFTSVSILSGFQILFAIAIAFYTHKAWKDNQLKLPKSSYWLLGFAVIALISLTINFDLIPKPSKNFGRVKYYLYGIGGIYVLRIWMKEASEKALKTLMYVFFAGVLVAGAYAIGEYFLGKDRRASGLTETMRYGYGTGMMLLSLLSVTLRRRQMPAWFNWKAATFVFVVAFMGMFLTYTRGALLGFLCGLPFVFYFWRPKVGLAFGLVCFLAIGTLGGIYLFGKHTTTEENRFILNKSNKSDAMRRSQWMAAIIATKERPVLGWGLSNFHSQLKRIKNQYDLEEKDYDDAHAHNLFLEVASGTGLIGLFFFLAWIVSWAWESFRADPLTRAVVIPFGVAFVVSSQFEVTFDANNASMIFFLYSLSSARGLRVE